MDVVVIGAGRRERWRRTAQRTLGARTALVTSAEFGGMAANDGPVPVRTLAHAAGLIAKLAGLIRYGIDVGAVLDYPRLLARVREVVADVRCSLVPCASRSILGVTVHEKAGTARFTDPHPSSRRPGFVSG